ncbi:MAG TPA: DNA polymerase III subunit delta [Acetobacteraceae bacterium]|nr:DNA polymerase III subunit delta [Acetobacteraceae bacterium]
MKLDARRIPAFLRDPGPARIVLLHGDDEGLIRHRADALTLAVVGQRDDPFRVAWLAREDHARLAEEASAIAMLGGRRVIRVRDAVDGLAPALEQIAAGPGDSLVVLEAGAALPSRSKLRALVEGSPVGAAIACYPEEGKALQDSIRAGLAEAGITLEADAMEWLLEHVGTDWAATRGEIEKLVLYAGQERRLGLEDVRACVGDAGSVAFDDAVFAATGGDAAAADRALERALAEGLAPVAVTRGVMQHLGKLHLARGHMAAGASAEDAVRALRPPVFFKRIGDFTRALRDWDAPRLAQAMMETRRVELACKQTGAPDALLVRRLILALARQGARLAG